MDIKEDVQALLNDEQRRRAIMKAQYDLDKDETVLYMDMIARINEKIERLSYVFSQHKNQFLRGVKPRSPKSAFAGLIQVLKEIIVLLEAIRQVKVVSDGEIKRAEGVVERFDSEIDSLTTAQADHTIRNGVIAALQLIERAINQKIREIKKDDAKIRKLEKRESI